MNFILRFLLFWSLWPVLALADTEGQNTRFSLIAEHQQFVPGETVWIAARFEMNPGWHIYWEVSGDSGLPTKLLWTVPEGVTVGGIQWPAPIRFVEADILVSHGYKNEVLLLVPVQTPDKLREGDPLTLLVNADWLECLDVCIPGSGVASITLTAGAPGEADPIFAEVRESIPAPVTDWNATHQTRDGKLTLTLTPPASITLSDGDLAFFPRNEMLWALIKGFNITRDGRTIRIQGELEAGVPVPETVSGVLVNRGGLLEGSEHQAVQFDAQPYLAAPQPVSLAEARRGIAGALLGAFIAGVMLNLLPCIFPVLGLKISGFVEQAHGDPKSVKLHALVFTGGILVSLWILGALVSTLGAAWGAQFQDPRVVIALLLVLTLFTMNLFGIFELGNSLTTVGGGLTRKQGYAGSFFQGVLLTVIATPCTGPFMAAMIGWMLTQSAFVGFLAFTAMGLGIALPYIVMAFSPKLIEQLPPPGMWMVTFKQGSAFLMVVFLWVMLYVLHSLQPAVTVRVAGAMMMICFASWVLGTWGAPHRRAGVRRAGKLIAVLLLLLSGWIAFSHRAPATSLTPELQARIDAGTPVRHTDLSPELAEQLLADGVPLHYRPFSPELVAGLRAAGQAVFVDFTAEWCTICKINKATTLHREEVMRAFQEKGVVTLRADWTARDDVIAETLARYGRRGVPVYLLYPPGGGEADILPEQLNPGIVLEALDKF